MVSLSGQAELTIERPIEEVWAFVADVTNQDRWVDGMSESELVGDPPLGKGSVVRGVYSVGGAAAVATTMTITEFQAPQRLAIVSEDGPFPFQSDLRLQRQGSSATLATNSVTAGSDHIVTSFMFTVLRPLSRMMMNRQMGKELSQLKAILESGMESDSDG